MTDDLETTAAPGRPSGRHRSVRPRRRRRTAAGRSAEDERDSEGSGGKRGGVIREFAILVVLVLGFTALLRGLAFQAYMIPSGSMENTLQVGDKILVNKLSYQFGDVERGDVVVFDGAGSFSPEIRTDEKNPMVWAGRWVWQLFGGVPANEHDFVKRVVGVGGDEVTCRRTDSGFAMFVNGERLKEESYLFPGDEPCRAKFAVVVPEGRLWVMGDHRSLSADSRVHVDDGHSGTVPEDQVIGRAFVVIWPTDHWGSLERPGTYEQARLDSASRHGIRTKGYPRLNERPQATRP